MNIRFPKLLALVVFVVITLVIMWVASFTLSNKEPVHFRHKCLEQDSAQDYSQVHIPLRFMKGKEKCLYYENEYFKEHYYRNLKEFIINKNNKYCLWDSPNWDEECQDAAMAYAYGDYYKNKPEAIQKYKEFKHTLINFIKYVQANDIEKALTLTHTEAAFFTDDDTNCLVKEISILPLRGTCRAYFKRNSEYKKRWGEKWGEINLELFRENLMQIDVDNIKFYLDDLTKTYAYSVVIPYTYNGIQKYFDIRFYFGFGGGGPAYPYDHECSPKIYDIGIHNKPLEER